MKKEEHLPIWVSKKDPDLCVQKVVEKTNVKISLVFILFLWFGVFRKQASSRGFGSDYRRLCLKIIKNVGKHSFSWKAGFCWIAIVSFSFLYNKLSKSTSRDPPGRPHFNFFGRWIFTRYSEIVTFSIWGPSGRPADRARAGAFSGTLSRPFFVKPWGDFDGNPQLILTIPFWSLFENRPFLGEKRVFGGSLLVVLGRWNCTRSNEIVTFSFLERLKIERSSLALSNYRKSENSNISLYVEQKSKNSVVFL